MVIREERRWSSEDVRAFCIRHNYYTSGTTVDYSRMLLNVDSRHPTATNIRHVAEDIMAHSTEHALDGRGLTTVMFDLFREAVFTFFTEIQEVPEVQETAELMEEEEGGEEEWREEP